MKKNLFALLLFALTLSMSGCYVGGYGYRDYRPYRYYNPAPRVMIAPPAVVVRPPSVVVRPRNYYRGPRYYGNRRRWCR